MDVQLSAPERMMRSLIQRYDHGRYWRYRSIVVDAEKGTKLGDYYRLWYIKRADAFNNASMGTHRNYGASFAEPPQLPHGLNGIIVSHNAVIGKDCRIFHQVTIGEGHGGAPVIGDHVVLGASCKIIGGIHIGNHVKVAAGCVVMENIPDHSVVFPGALDIRIRQRSEDDEA